MEWLTAYMDISIHAPSRERHVVGQLNFAIYEFQSTLPRGSDVSATDNYIIMDAISIHAPSRERPLVTCKFTQGLHISIHAPSRERH